MYNVCNLVKGIGMRIVTREWEGMDKCDLKIPVPYRRVAENANLKVAKNTDMMQCLVRPSLTVSAIYAVVHGVLCIPDTSDHSARVLVRLAFVL